MFFGAAVFVNVAEQPARLALDDRAMLLEWQRSYNRAAPMQAGLAAVSALLGFIAAWQMRDWRWAVGAIMPIGRTRCSSSSRPMTGCMPFRPSRPMPTRAG